MQKYTILLLLFFTGSFAVRAQEPSPTIPPVKREQSPETVAALETHLKQNPKDADARKKIIAVYERDEKNPESKKALQRHRLAFVKNNPAEWNFGVLGFWGEGDAGSAEFVELRDEFLRQVAADRSNNQVRLQAVSFLKAADPSAAEKLLLEGEQISPDEKEFYGELVGIYEERIRRLNESYDNGTVKDVSADFKKYSEMILAQGEKQVAIYDKDEYGRTGGEKLDRLVQMGRIALETGDSKRARGYAETIIRDYDADDPEAGDVYPVYYGNLLLGRVALREGNAEKAKEHLAKSLLRVEEGEFEVYRLPEMDLAFELVGAGEREAALEHIRSLLKFTKDEDFLKTLRRWERVLSRGLMPFDFDN